MAEEERQRLAELERQRQEALDKLLGEENARKDTEMWVGLGRADCGG